MKFYLGKIAIVGLLILGCSPTETENSEATEAIIDSVATEAVEENWSEAVWSEADSLENFQYDSIRANNRWIKNRIDSVVTHHQKGKKNYYKSTEKAESKAVQLQKIDTVLWQKIIQDRNYIEKEEEEDSNDFEPFRMPKFNIQGLGVLAELLRLLIYFGLFVGISYGLFLLYEKKFKPALSSQSLTEKALIEKLDEKIHEVDLDALLAKYKARNDYKTCIRIYYLIIVKQLSQKQMIDWKKEKTNGNYLQELFGKAFFEPYKKMTHIYERIWFGNDVVIDQKQFEEVEKIFIENSQKLKH